MLIAALFTPFVIRWYQHNNWLEQPNTGKHVKRTHRDAVPRGGGLVVGVTILASALLFLTIDKYLIAILGGVLMLAVVGFIDDIADIHPLWRLAVGCAAALLVVGSGIGIAYVTNPMTLFSPEAAAVFHLNEPQIPITLFGELHTIWIVADLLAIIFIIWNMNIVNWSKGVDGQLPSFVAAAAVFIGLLSYRFIDDPTQFNTAHLAFIVAGAYAGYLLWNWYPQKTMPGYGGGSIAGFLLAVLAILSGAKVATMLMVLAIPTADAIFTIARRIRAGKSPIWGDRGHLHHKLLDVLGWGRRRIAVFYTASSIILGILALYLSTLGKIITLVVTFSLVFSFLIWAKYKSTKTK